MQLKFINDIQMIVLDGGIGRHLEKLGAPFGQPEW
jgi:Homocysteine/selenocysteine methylase (S-methylmethionine-dependent)